MRHSEERGLGIDGTESIILVTGRHLARSWIRAVFSDSRGGASFVAKVSEDSVVHLEKRSVSGAQLEFGPNGEVGFCIISRTQTELRDESDATHTRICQRTNVYSFEVTTSSAS